MPLAIKGKPIESLSGTYYSGEEVDWLIRIYECWQIKADEKLHEELKKAREKHQDLYDFLIRQLLAWVAGEGDLDTFCRILDEENFSGFCIHAVEKFWIYDGANQLLKKLFPKLVTTLFITEKEEFLDEIVKRSGILRVCDIKQRTYFAHGMKTIQTCLPEACLAIMTGNMHMAEYFRKNRGYSSGVIKRTEIWNRDMIIVRDNPLIENDLTLLDLALISRSKEMIDFVLKYFPNIPWNDQLSICIMQSRGCISHMILKYHPELFEFLSVTDIFRYRHKIFLDAYLERCEKQGKCPDEEILGIEKEQLLTMCGNLLGENGVVLFYRKAFSAFTDKLIKRTLLRMLVADYTASGQKSLAALFFKYRDVELDFSDYFDMMITVKGKTGESGCRFMFDGLYEIFGDDTAEKIPIDLYKIQPEAIAGFTRKEVKKVLRRTRPIKIQNELDALSHRLLKLNDVKLVEEAVNRGFITKKNKSALMRAAQELKAQTGVKAVLLRVECNAALADRYV